ncbi:MAG: DUF4932 domain-containing protein [Planctomycetes bacterium]|nr:DUF4932 domain-containing protein [Planctomycetota bacterium]MBI3845565.1 DUF4932 domain-containing protein [Planctomycetota bacterium]
MNRSLALALALAAFARSAAEKSTVRISVDPRVELLSVVELLSGYERTGLITRFDVAYKKTVSEKFAAQREHRAVKLFDEMSRRGFSFDAPFAAILHFGAPPELAPRVEPSEYVCGRAGSKAKLLEFVDALRDFALASDFMKFFESQQPLYDTIVADAKTKLAGVDVSMVEAYYGDRAKSYDIFLAPLLHPGGFGPRVIGDGGVEVYSIQGPYGAAAGQPTYGTAADFRYLVWHEFSHSFVNPLVDRFADAIDETDDLWVPLRERMEEQGYGNWRNSVYEHVVRAVTVRFAYRELGDAEGKKALDDETSHAFAHVPALTEALKRYEAERDRYPKLADFFPQIVAIFDKAAAAAPVSGDAKKPKIVRTTPKSGDRAVDPAVTQIEIEFDVDMDVRGFAWLQRDAATFPEKTGDPKWTSKRTCVMPVKLAADHEYWIGVNNFGIGGFKSAAGRAAGAFALEFKTASSR